MANKSMIFRGYFAIRSSVEAICDIWKQSSFIISAGAIWLKISISLSRDQQDIKQSVFIAGFEIMPCDCYCVVYS